MSDFTLIPPVIITDDILTSTNVVETPPAAYNSGTTYALDDQVSVFTGTTATIYKSLQGGNLNNTPASSPLWWQEMGVSYKVWDSVTAYSIGDKVIDLATHSVYESIQAGTNHVVTDTDYWFRFGDTNAWKMFGALTAVQSEWYERIVTVLEPTGIINGIALYEIQAESVTITINDGVDDIYTGTTSLIDNSGIVDYFNYFFDPIIYKNKFAMVDGLGNVNNPIVTIDLNATAANVKFGKVVIGQTRTYGKTRQDVTITIRDFSDVQEDVLGGDPYIVERAYRNDADIVVWVPETQKDDLHRNFVSFRATPIAVIANPDYQVGILYGLVSFRLGVNQPTYDIFDVKVKGL